jgi:hypothetical protein
MFQLIFQLSPAKGKCSAGKSVNLLWYIATRCLFGKLSQGFVFENELPELVLGED